MTCETVASQAGYQRKGEEKKIIRFLIEENLKKRHIIVKMIKYEPRKGREAENFALKEFIHIEMFHIISVKQHGAQLDFFLEMRGFFHDLFIFCLNVDPDLDFLENIFRSE